MHKVFPRFQILLATILSVSQSGSYERSRMETGSFETLLNARRQENSQVTPQDMAPLSSLLPHLQEQSGLSSGTSASSPQSIRQPTAQPIINESAIPSPQRPTASPKIPASPSPQPYREPSPQLIGLSKMGSESDLLVRPASSLSLQSLSGSSSTTTIIYRDREEDLPVPFSLCLAIETYALSKEYMKHPGTPPFSVQPEFVKLKKTVRPEMWTWVAQSQGLWAEYRSAQELKRKTEARYIRKRDAFGQGDLTESVMNTEPSKTQPAAGLFSSILPQRSEMTTEQKNAAILQKAQEDFESATKAFKIVQAKAQALHPGLTIPQIEALAYAIQPINLYAPYFKKPTDFKKSQYYRAFTLDPTDLRIALFMLEGSTTPHRNYPGRVERRDNENSRFVAVNTAYRRDLIMRAGGWLTAAAWKDWYDLKGEKGPLNEIKRKLMELYPYQSIARLKRDESTTKGFVLAVLNLDNLGHVLTQAYLQYIKTFKDPLSIPNPHYAAEQQLLNDQYRNLPKHFYKDGTPLQLEECVAAGAAASQTSFFERVYQGCDLLTPDEGTKDGIFISFFKVMERRYAPNRDEHPTPFIPVKGSFLATQNLKLAEEYRLLVADLRAAKDVAASETAADVVIANPVVEKMAKMPEKFARMVREYPSFVSMEFHRSNYYKVLQQLHLERKPVLIGIEAVEGERLTKPREMRPDQDPIKPDYDPDQLRRYQDLSAREKILLEKNRALLTQLMTSPGALSKFPYAFDFVVFTKPLKPQLDNQSSSKTPQFGQIPHLLSLEYLGINDAHLKRKYRTSDGQKKGLFASVTELSLMGNSLVDPEPDIDFTNLSKLNVSRNQLTSLRFLDRLWGQMITLHASHNRLTELPLLPGLDNPPLDSLNLASNSFNDLTRLSRFVQLKELDISGNHLLQITYLATLLQLQKLTANSCALAGDWSTVLPSLPSLTFLSVSSNARLLLLPHSTQKVISSSMVAANNTKFNAAFPKLETLIEQRELKAVTEIDVGSATGIGDSHKVLIIKPIKLSDLTPTVDERHRP